MAARKKKPKLLACRNCGATTKTDRDTLSGFVHSHPEVCRYRRDKVPAMNGVHVGDLWENLHTGHVIAVIECRLGGTGTYTDREPVYVTGDVWQPAPEGQLAASRPTVDELAKIVPEADGFDWISPTTMWSLVEHYEPLTRPGEYPVPWEIEELHGRPSRSALDGWRTGGCHNPSGIEVERDDTDHAYYHAFHVRDSRWSLSWHQGWLIEATEPVEAELPDELHQAVVAAKPATPRAQEAEQLELAIG